MSKMIYLMPVWMGCEDYLVNALQVCQNKVARLVTKMDRYTPTQVLLKQCGWLPVRQLLAYHSLVLLHKVIKQQQPDFLFKKITSGSGQPKTRQDTKYSAAIAAAGAPEPPAIDSCELEVSRKSWCWASPHLYRQLPVELCTEQESRNFKTRLKQWVTLHVD